LRGIPTKFWRDFLARFFGAFQGVALADGPLSPPRAFPRNISPVKDRIQKVLAAAGVASRRHVEEMVLQGRIEVNGKVVTSLPVMVDAEHDRIKVDGENVRVKNRISAERIYLLMNKPRGVLTTNVAQGEQKRAIDLLPPGFPYRVFPVGRLDAESRGLLLLTNDGELTNRLTHPRFGVAKTYRAVVNGYIKPEAVQQLEKGMWLADPKKGGFKTGRSRIKIVDRSRDKSVLEITVREGRSGQVRRMLARIGHKLKELTRIKMGPLELRGLEPGEFRELTPRELRALQKAVTPSSESASDRSS
jgi:23S rRNA pseudouridine2605 synthase